MFLNNSFNVLPWYDSLDKQNSKNWYAYGQSWPLLCPQGFILPFQFVCEELEITSSIQAINIKTGEAKDLGITPTISLGTRPEATYYVVKLPSQAIPVLPIGTYYLKFNTSLGPLYSEEITFVDDTNKCVKIQYWNDNTLYFTSGEIDFSDEFKFELYIRSTIGKPEYEFEEELTKRLGYKFIESQTSNKIYKFSFVAPEYICDAMRLIRLCDFIKITTLFDSYNALSFAYEPRWEDQGDLAAVEVEFDTDCIIQKLESFNRRLKESFYNALLADVDEPVLFSTDTVAQYYTEFTSSVSLINGKLIRQLDPILPNAIVPNLTSLVIPVDNSATNEPAKKLFLSDLLNLITFDTANFVTITGIENITGEKNFTGGLKVNGSPITYNSEKGYWKLEGDLLITGGITQYASETAFKPSTIMSALVTDGVNLQVIDGVLTFMGETNGLDEEALQKYLDDYNYAKLTDVDSRINDLVNGAPAAYDTLKEIADVLQGNVNSIGDIITTLGTKADKTYVDTELAKYIPIAGDTEVTGIKDFLNGLKVGGLPISKYEGYDDVIYIDANVVLRGGLTQYAVDPVTIPSIIESLPQAGYESKGVASFSSEFFAIDANGKVSIIPDSVGLNEEELEEWLADSDYATKTYADDRYFLASNFTKTNIAAKLGISDWALAATKPSYTTKEVTEDTNLYFTNQRAIDALTGTLKAYVTLKGTQTIEGEKDFTGGLKVNGSPIVYDSENGYWLLQGNLLITGGLTQYVDDGSVDLPNLYDGLPIDNQTIYWAETANGKVLKAKVAEGGITSITSQMVVEALGFTPYDASNPNGYITSAALNGYATQTWVNQQGFLTEHQDLSGYQPKITSSAKLAASLVSGLAAVATSGSYNDLSNKPTIPSNTNQLTNGAGFITSSASITGNAATASLIKPTSGTYQASTWNPLTSYTKIWGEAFINSAITSDSGDMIFYLRPSVYNSGTTELCVAIDGDFYAQLGTKKVWHEGNFTPSNYLLASSYTAADVLAKLKTVDGSGSGLDADTLDGLHWNSFMRQFDIITSANTGNALLAGAFRFNTTLTGLPNGATNYGSMLTVRGGNYDTLWQMYGNYDNDRLFYRRGNLTGLTSNAWKQIAFIDSNVASATKLQAKRSLWGNDFDGTASINGSLYLANHGLHLAVTSALGWNQTYILATGWTQDTGDFTDIYVPSSGANDARLRLLKNGNVGIGTTSPTRKLEVVSSEITPVSIVSSSTTEASISYKYGNASAWVVGAYNDTFFFYSHKASSQRFYVDSSGNGLFYGGLTQYSDIRKKTKLQDVELTLKQVANAPLIEHYYNSDDKKTTHVGSIAQYWAEMNDWFCKLDSDGFYTMEIQNAALASAISVARELERYESKTDKSIRMLKKRINELEDEIEKLKNVA